MSEPRIIIATTPQEREDAFGVRIAVFVGEQGIPRSEELDDFDASATHCVGYIDGVPVAAGRLIIMDDHRNYDPLSPSGRGVAEGRGEGPYAKIGRMAVLASHRRSGLGALVLDALECEGAARGVRRFKLSAQLHARGFYDRCGYTAHGDVYDDVGIPHIDMDKRL